MNLNEASRTTVVTMHRVIDYHSSEVKSIQDILYEAAQEINPDEYSNKWKIFRHRIERDGISNRQVKKIISSLDNERRWAAVHYAVDCNNFQFCKTITSKDEPYQCDGNILGGNGENVLHVASGSDRLWSSSLLNNELPPLVKLLVGELHVKVNHADDEGRTPLHVAALHGRKMYIDYLIENQAEVGILSKANASVLHFVLYNNRMTCPRKLYSIVEGLLQQPSVKEEDLPNRSDLENKIPLVLLICHRALQQEFVSDSLALKAVRDLLTIFSKDLKNERHLLLAIDELARSHSIQRFDHLKLLAKSCPLWKSVQKQVLHLACRHDNANLLRWFIDQEELREHLNTNDHAGYTPLLTATFYNSIKCVKILLEASNDDRVGNAGKSNILHICAKRRVSKALFQMLLGQLSVGHIEEMLQSPDREGNLPLHLVASTNETQPYICEGLIKAARKIPVSYDSLSNQKKSLILHILSVQNRAGRTAAHEASIQGNIRVLKMMWKAIPRKERKNQGEGLFITDHNRFTCLHLAAIHGDNEESIKVIEYLIHCVRIEVDVIGDRRRTPLHLASEYGHLKVVKYLIEKGNASTILRNAQVLNCLEISIIRQHEEIVKYFLSRPDWRQMMRNAQPIEGTEAYDTPMRKLIRYMPKVALWMVEENLTQKVGGESQHVFKELYDYEFYEDMYKVKQWYARGAKVFIKARSDSNTIYGFCDKSAVNDEEQNREQQFLENLPYTNDPYTLVRNHPLVIVSQQSSCPELIQHNLHTMLLRKIFRRFGVYWLAFSIISYIILLGIWTATILRGTHPQYFYSLVGLNMTLDIDTCKEVVYRLVSQNVTEALKTDRDYQLQDVLYALFLIFIIKNTIFFLLLIPKFFHTTAYYAETVTLILSLIYIFDWYGWQTPVIVRCPIQYQIGAMGVLLSWINLLNYIRCIPWFNLGIYIAMFHVMLQKWFNFLPVLTIIVCGYGLTYWMLLQNQAVFASPIEALLRTSFMMFDLGYESRLYSSPAAEVHYKLVYVMMMLTAVVFCVISINLMIGLAVGEIPSLLAHGALWRTQMVYNLMSDHEIVRLQLCRFCNFFSNCAGKRTVCLPRGPILLLTDDRKCHTYPKKAWLYVHKRFFVEQIQDTIVA